MSMTPAEHSEAERQARQALRRVAATQDGKTLLNWLYARYVFATQDATGDESALRAQVIIRNRVLQIKAILEQPLAPQSQAATTGRPKPIGASRRRGNV